MDDYFEIDLRKVIKNLLAHWFWIVLPAILVGAAVFLYSYTRPVRYQAQAQILLSDPAFQISLTTEITTNPPTFPSEEALTTMLLSDDIVAELFELWDCDPAVKASCSLSRFKNNYLDVNVGRNTMLVTLTVKGESTQNVALLANAWADLAVQKLNVLVYGFDPNKVVFFEEQVANARLDLDQAEANLLAFTEEDPRVGLSNQLNTLIATQRESLAQIRSLETATDDLLKLIAQIDAEPALAPLDSAYRFNFILIQTRIYSGIEWDSFPVQVLVDYDEGAETMTVGEFTTMLETLVALIDDQMAKLDQDQSLLTPRISALRAEISEIDNVENALSMAYTRVQKLYELLAIKLDESNLVFAGNRDSGALVISQATVPEPGDRLPRDTMRNTGLAAIVTGFIAVAGVLFVDWWQEPEKNSEEA